MKRIRNIADLQPSKPYLIFDIDYARVYGAEYGWRIAKWDPHYQGFTYEASRGCQIAFNKVDVYKLPAK